MNIIDKKKEVIKYSKLFHKNNFSPIRSGNISVKFKLRNQEGFLISPSGKKNSELHIKDLVFVSMDGVSESDKKPSSEWRFHMDLYKSSNCNAIVHAHSKFSVVCSCLYEFIPPFHYMIALTGNKQIRVAKYALFGTQKLSNNILKAIKKSKSCLIAHHGQIAIGGSLSEAYELAEEVELLCEYYYYCKLKKAPKNISSKEMTKVLDKIKKYKS